MKDLRILCLTIFIFLFLQESKGQKTLHAKNCSDIVTNILTSSPRFQKLTKNLYARVKKNGGTGYGIMLDASPNPSRDNANATSENYELSLHETYKDRIVNIAHFEFNPKTNLLYEVSMIDPDQPKPISFNKKLLVGFNKACK